MIQSFEDGKLLLIKTRMASDIARAVAGAEYYHDRELPSVLIPWTMEATQIVSGFMVPVISTMLRDYSFRASFKPFLHQKKICSFLACNRRSFCLAGMGTGKTACGAWTADYLLRAGYVKKILVMCDMNNMRRTWQDEFFNINPGITTEVLHATTRDKKLELAASSAQVHIINHDGVKSLYNELLANDYDLVIVDELTRFKNSRADRSKNACKICDRARWVWGFTGTPTPNSPDEAYGQIKLVNPSRMAGISYFQFKNMVMRKLSDFKWVPRDNAAAIVNYYMQPAIRIKKEECLDLPPVTTAYSEVDLTKDQAALYTKMRKDRGVKSDNTEITAVNGAALMGKLIQICTGAIYDDSGEAYTIDVAPRIDQTVDYIERSRAESTDPMKGKTIVFVPFKHTAALVTTELSKKFDVATITGDVSIREREKILRSFQTEMHPDVLVAVPQTMSHGVTATSASTIVWFGPVTSNEVYQQACERINRSGQTQHMHIVHLYSSKTEWQLFKVLQDRQVTQNTLLNLYRDFIKGLD